MDNPRWNRIEREFMPKCTYVSHRYACELLRAAEHVLRDEPGFEGRTLSSLSGDDDQFDNGLYILGDLDSP
jgi:hypothetical protein